MSFLTPLFLAAAGVALVPILLHLVRRMKAREMPFSSLMFLSATPMERLRRRKIRDVLLLILRMAMIILLATAFARPYLMRAPLPFVSERTDESVVILLDQSLSMQAQRTFEEAQDAVERIIAQASGRDELALVSFSDHATQLSPLTRDTRELGVLAAAAQPSYRTTDILAALQVAENILKEARHSAQRVVLISDLQQSGFRASIEEYTLPEGVTFEPVLVGTEARDNRHFAAVSLSSRQRGSGTVTQIGARYLALSADEEVSLWIGEEELDRRSSGEPGLRTVSFQYVAPRAGIYQGHLALADDDLIADNRYYITFRVAARPAVLAVAADRDAFFLQRAFDLGQGSRFDFSAATRLSASALLRSDVVFVTNTARLSSTESALLSTFATRGGTVIVGFGDAVQTPGYGLERLGVGQVTEVVRSQAPGGSAHIGQVEAQHPIFAPLASSSALIRPTFRGYVRLAPTDSAIVVARYDNGDPFLVERRIGQGTILVYTSSFGTSWTDLALQELYLPFLYQMATYGTALREPPRQFVVAESVTLTGMPHAEWNVSTPEGQIHKVVMNEEGTGVFAAPETPGHYVAAAEQEQYRFSVNTDPAESALKARTAEEAYAAVVSRSSGATTPEEEVLSIGDTESDQKLWRLAVILVLGLFALETVLSHRNRKAAQA